MKTLITGGTGFVGAGITPTLTGMFNSMQFLNTAANLL